MSERFNKIESPEMEETSREFPYEAFRKSDSYSPARHVPLLFHLREVFKAGDNSAIDEFKVLLDDMRIQDKKHWADKLGIEYTEELKGGEIVLGAENALKNLLRSLNSYDPVDVEIASTMFKGNSEFCKAAALYQEPDKTPAITNAIKDAGGLIFIAYFMVPEWDEAANLALDCASDTEENIRVTIANTINRSPKEWCEVAPDAILKLSTDESADVKATIADSLNEINEVNEELAARMANNLMQGIVEPSGKDEIYIAKKVNSLFPEKSEVENVRSINYFEKLALHTQLNAYISASDHGVKFQIDDTNYTELQDVEGETYYFTMSDDQGNKKVFGPNDWPKINVHPDDVERFEAVMNHYDLNGGALKPLLESKRNSDLVTDEVRDFFESYGDHSYKKIMRQVADEEFITSGRNRNEETLSI